MAGIVLALAGLTCGDGGPGTGAAAAPADKAAQALKELQGTWTLVGMESKGEKVTTEELKQAGGSFVIQGNELLLKENGVTKARFSFTLDPTRSPRHINLQQRGDRAAPGTCHAIYSLEKEELKVCLGTNFNPNEARERPQEFATILGSKGRPPKGKNLFILKRSKE